MKIEIELDDAIRDLSWIDDECRRARSELEAGHE